MADFALQGITLQFLPGVDRRRAGLTCRPVASFVAVVRPAPFSQISKGHSMYPVHDVDALLLLATTLASKRRPAELAEIMAAADLIQGTVPSELKLVESFQRLSAHGLILELDGGFTLTPVAQAIMAGQPKGKLEKDERLYRIKEKLGAFHGNADQPKVELTVERIAAAILAHRTTLTGPGRNLLIAKPKPAETDRHRPGQRQRRPLPKHRRKP
jgi:hypothetical protein